MLLEHHVEVTLLPVGLAQIDDDHMRVRAVGIKLQTGVAQALRQSSRPRDHVAHQVAEGGTGDKIVQDRACGDDMRSRGRLQPGRKRIVDRLAMHRFREDESPCARPAKSLVRRGGDDIAIRGRVGMESGDDQPRDMGEIGK